MYARDNRDPSGWGPKGRWFKSSRPDSGPQRLWAFPLFVNSGAAGLTATLLLLPQPHSAHGAAAGGRTSSRERAPRPASIKAIASSAKQGAPGDHDGWARSLADTMVPQLAAAHAPGVRSSPHPVLERGGAPMSQPSVFISTFRLKHGKLGAFKQMCQGLVELVWSAEPRVIAFNLYANEDGTEVSNVQVHPDADSMVSHRQLLREHISSAGRGEFHRRHHEQPDLWSPERRRRRDDRGLRPWCAVDHQAPTARRVHP
jgi:hypothetical protein